jgi:hypothetical protein
VNDGEGEEKFLGSRIFKALFGSVPASTLEIKTVNEDSFRDLLKLFSFDSAVISLDDFLEYLSLIFDLIKRPLLSFALTGNFLLHGSKETLRVEETGQPEGLRSLLGDPVVQLEVTIK